MKGLLDIFKGLLEILKGLLVFGIIFGIFVLIVYFTSPAFKTTFGSGKAQLGLIAQGDEVAIYLTGKKDYKLGDELFIKAEIGENKYSQEWLKANNVKCIAITFATLKAENGESFLSETISKEIPWGSRLGDHNSDLHCWEYMKLKLPDKINGTEFKVSLYIDYVMAVKISEYQFENVEKSQKILLRLYPKPDNIKLQPIEKSN